MITTMSTGAQIAGREIVIGRGAGLLAGVLLLVTGCPSEPPPTVENGAPPVALDLSITVTAGQPHAGFLAADHPEGLPVRFRLDEAPSLGSVEIEPEGRFRYLAGPHAAGEDRFTFRVADGRHESEPATVTVTVTRPPLPAAVFIDQGPESPTARTEASFVVTAELPGPLMCRLDDGDETPCESPVTYTDLAEGSHAFEVWLADEPRPPARWAWTIDLTPPRTTLVAGPASPSRREDATFAFEADEPATFRCRLGDGPWADCESPWRVEGLAEGLHRVEVQAVDRAGNHDPDPAAWTWEVDLTPPTTTLLATPPWLTFVGTARFEFEADEPATFECRLGDGHFLPCESPFEIEDAGPGAHAFAVRAMDEAGNVEPSPVAHDWFVAQTVSHIVAGPSPYWGSDEAAFEFVSFAPVAGHECRMNDGPWETCESPVVYDALPEGAHLFSVRGVDAEGVVEPQPPTHGFVVDVTPPVVQITSGPPPRTRETAAAFTFEASEPADLECSLDGEPYAPCESPVTYDGLSDGARDFRVRAFDRAGNETGEPAEWAWEIDTEPPVTTVLSGPDAETSERDATFTFTCDKAECTFSCKLSGQWWAPCESPAVYTDLPTGIWRFEVRATDDVGNVEVHPPGWTWLLDASPVVEVDAFQDWSCAVRADGTLWCSGPWTGGPGQVGERGGWYGLSVGRTRACALRDGGTLWCFVPGVFDELEQVGDEGGWDHVSSGNSHTCAVRDDTSLWCWGSNFNGQLGLGDTSSRSEPTQVAGSGWSEVSAGGFHTCALMSDDTLWCWGRNTRGQLGDGTTTERTAPVQVGDEGAWRSVVLGDEFTCALRDPGSLWCWGSGSDGQLGTGSLSFTNPEPLRAGDDDDWAVVAAGTRHACGLRNGGTLWCWGDNTGGRVGDGTLVRRTTPVRVGDETGWLSVAAGHGTCGLRETGDLWCWGPNDRGQLGLYGDRPSLLPGPVVADGPFTTVSARRGSTCAIADDGTLWCWGAVTPVPAGGLVSRQAPVRVDAGTDWSMVNAGGHSHCAIDAAGTSWCWRRPSAMAGWIGIWIAASRDHTCAIDLSDGLWCVGRGTSGQLGDGTGSSSDTLVPVAFGSAWHRVATGLWHSCGLQVDGTLWCWGAAAQVGDGNSEQRDAPVEVGAPSTWVEVAAGSEHSCAIDSDGGLWCWGSNGSGRLGLGDTAFRGEPTQVSPGSTWKQVDAGAQHTCAIDTSDRLWCWGSALGGRLGHGESAGSELSPVLVGGGDAWADVSTGGQHTCGIRTDGSLRCWGLGSAGQRGDGVAWIKLPELLHLPGDADP